MKTQLFRSLNSSYMRILQVITIASILLGAGIAVASLSNIPLASARIGWATGNIIFRVPCLDPNVDCIADQFVDPFNITTRTHVMDFEGMLTGTSIGVETYAVNTETNIVTATAVHTFTGDIIGRRSGSFVWIFTFKGNLTAFYEDGVPITGTLKILEGFGQEEFRGMCGRGTFEASPPPITTYYELIFAFDDDDCDFIFSTLTA